MGRISAVLSLLLLLCACAPSNLLTYKYHRHYHEQSIITSDSVFTLYQNINYNVPHIIDEEFSYELTFQFKDSLAAKNKKYLNLATDTGLVKTNYDIFSVWSWDAQKSAVTGEIEILKWNKNEVVLKENVTVKDFTNNETKHYRGTRRFIRKEGW